MKKIEIIFLLFLTINFLSAQNLDSLYNVFINGLEYFSKESIVQVEETERVKCGLPLLQLLRSNFDKLTIEQQNRITEISTRPQTQTSFVTPSGKFRIHYDTTGTHKVTYNLNELAEAFDSSWNYEINLLDYPPPPSDGLEGGDELYDVYIQDLGNVYGWTDAPSNSESPSYIVIDNDFTVHFTTGIDGARVTAAHELHHAIQFGHYKYKAEEAYYYELLSTSMEEFVFDTINDYYNYLPDYYDNPELPFYSTKGGGYELAIWNIFLKEKYGFDVIKRGLENIVNTSALEAMANAITEFGGIFKEDFSQFALWNYFTGSRAKEGMYFKEAANYPKIGKYQPISLGVGRTVYSNPVSTTYHRLVDFSRGLPDTLVAIISNCDYLGNSKREFTFTVFDFPEEGSSMINDFYYSILTSPSLLYFIENDIFNNEPAVIGKTEQEEIDYSFPQPFNYSKHTTLFIPCGRDVSGKASLNIYTSSMDLVFSGEKNIFATDKIVVAWNGKTDKGEKLSTGVYIFVTKAGDNVKKGKIVIYNE